MESVKKYLQMMRDFFPMHLLFSHFKYNIIVLFYWLFLFSIINGYFGHSFGLMYLFLSPEYLNKSSFLSFIILGFSVGGFIMAFHTYSYMRLGPKYPFLATLARPFFKFSINNSLIPLVFLINMMINIILFQRNQELESSYYVVTYAVAFLVGVLIFILLAFLYFFPTNKDLFKLTGKREEDFKAKTSNIQSTIHRKQKWYNDFLGGDDDTYYYIGRGFQIRQSRSCQHYDIEVLNSVFTQNHTNASFYELALLVSFALIGFLKDHEFFQVPASVSVMMLLTIVLMLVSALFSWFKNWTYPLIIGVFFVLNYLSINTEIFSFKSYAFGLSYDKESLTDFNPVKIRQLGLNEEFIRDDLNEFKKTLINWKDKTGENKPKLIVLNTSGGGLRSALWTFTVLQELDAATDKKFFEHVNMITGASGGMIGAAYYRELALKEKQQVIGNRLFMEYRNRMGSDLLNRIAFSISTSDIFFRFQKVELNGHQYTKDRGYAFEEELMKNLDGAFSKTLGDYSLLEKEAVIPTMIFAPTIINDGRRLIMGAQHLSFLNHTVAKRSIVGLAPEVENVEYLRFFEKNNPLDIRFTTVLRMNATFPYIMPMVTMPSKPGMQIMDAGMRHNYGTKITVQYLLAFSEWIRENTSGVILVKMRDTKKKLKDETYREIGLVEKLFLPFGNMYGNFPRVQDFDQDELILTKMANQHFPLDVVTFNLRERFDDVISLSWHLTKQEKQRIMEAVNSPDNKAELERLKKIVFKNYDRQTK